MDLNAGSAWVGRVGFMRGSFSLIDITGSLLILRNLGKNTDDGIASAAYDGRDIPVFFGSFRTIKTCVIRDDLRRQVDDHRFELGSAGAFELFVEGWVFELHVLLLCRAGNVVFG